MSKQFFNKQDLEKSFYAGSECSELHSGSLKGVFENFDEYFKSLYNENKPNGVELIAKERQHQIDKHGFTAEHHALNSHIWYDDGQLTDAANTLSMKTIKSCLVPVNWDYEWFMRLTQKSHKERLIIAGALIAAELDRLHFLEENTIAIPGV